MQLGTALTSGTAMTLDARFTQLRRGDSLYQDGVGRGSTMMGGGRSNRQEAVTSASARNRRLAIQMSRRPAVVAALNRGPPRNIPNGIMNRLGRGTISAGDEVGTFRSNAAFAANNNNIKRRSNSVNRIRGPNIGGGISIGGGFKRGGGGRRGGGRRGGNRESRPLVRSNSVNRLPRSGSLGRLSRSGSMGNLSRSGSLNRLTRSQSLQSLSGWANSAFRGRGMGRGRRRGRGRGGGVIQGFVARRRDSFGRKGSGGIGGGGGVVGQGNFRMGRGRGNFRGTRGIVGNRNFRGARSNNAFRFRGGRGGAVGRGGAAGGRGGPGAGRGFRGGRGGRGRGGGRGRQKVQVPTKEALDMEIDEYMSSTKSHLDKEIDSYMNQPAEETITVNQTNGTVTESWD